MPISSSLSARLGPGPAPAPAQWGPYARPSEPRRTGAGSGCAKASRPPLRLEPATERLLGPARRAESRGSSRGAAAPTPARRRLGDLKKSDPKTDPKPAGTNPEPIQEPRVEESRGCGGFAFLCALAGHEEAITGISMPMGSDKLYSGSADGSVRVWDGNSGKCVDVIKMGGKIGCMITHDKWVFIGIPKSVEAWNTQTGMKLSLQGPSGLVCSMTIKDEMLFAGTADGRIMAWKFPAKEINSEPVSILAGHDRHVITLAVSATRLYSGSLDKTIRVWDLKNLQCVQTLSEHKASVTSVLCWDQKLLSCSLDKTVNVWAASDSGNLQLMHTHSEEHLLDMCYWIKQLLSVLK
ncbi:zinc finger CCCH domain-containing protein 17-like isoform X3 [Triticum urartu]|uniref:zinc finger CCCH domain-containing protein 17-like isoform X3 n=1 Tax=Triticum urartu TaxID=4572 RepID=UPI002042E445|nr:zinc finger CCCH domain-containing protein 17-like isoform X3 [Triticum urartu]